MGHAFVNTPHRSYATKSHYNHQGFHNHRHAHPLPSSSSSSYTPPNLRIGSLGNAGHETRASAARRGHFHDASRDYEVNPRERAISALLKRRHTRQAAIAADAADKAEKWEHMLEDLSRPSTERARLPTAKSRVFRNPDAGQTVPSRLSRDYARDMPAHAPMVPKTSYSRPTTSHTAVPAGRGATVGQTAKSSRAGSGKHATPAAPVASTVGHTNGATTAHTADKWSGATNAPAVGNVATVSELYTPGSAKKVMNNSSVSELYSPPMADSSRSNVSVLYAPPVRYAVDAEAVHTSPQVQSASPLREAPVVNATKAEAPATPAKAAAPELEKHVGLETTSSKASASGSPTSNLGTVAELYSATSEKVHVNNTSVAELYKPSAPAQSRSAVSTLYAPPVAHAHARDADSVTAAPSVFKAQVDTVVTVVHAEEPAASVQPAVSEIETAVSQLSTTGSSTSNVGTVAELYSTTSEKVQVNNTSVSELYKPSAPAQSRSSVSTLYAPPMVHATAEETDSPQAAQSIVKMQSNAPEAAVKAETPAEPTKVTAPEAAGASKMSRMGAATSNLATVAELYSATSDKMQVNNTSVSELYRPSAPAQSRCTVSTLYAPPMAHVDDSGSVGDAQSVVKIESNAPETPVASAKAASAELDMHVAVDTVVIEPSTTGAAASNLGTVAELYSATSEKVQVNNTSVAELYKPSTPAQSRSTVSTLYAPPVALAHAKDSDSVAAAPSVVMEQNNTPVETVQAEAPAASVKVAAAELETGASKLSTMGSATSNLGTVAELYSATSEKMQVNNTSVSELYKPSAPSQSRSSVSMMYAPPVAQTHAEDTVVKMQSSTVQDVVPDAVETHSEAHAPLDLVADAKQEKPVAHDIKVFNTPISSTPGGSVATVSELYAPASAKKRVQNTSVSELYKPPATAESRSSVSMLYAPPAAPAVDASVQQDVAAGAVNGVVETQDVVDTVLETSAVEAKALEVSSTATGEEVQKPAESVAAVSDSPAAPVNTGRVATVVELYAPAWAQKLWNNTSVSELYKAPVTPASASSVSLLYSPPKHTDGVAAEEAAPVSALNAATELQGDGMFHDAPEAFEVETGASSVTDESSSAEEKVHSVVGANVTKTKSSPAHVNNVGTVAELYTAESAKQIVNNTSVSELYTAPVNAKSETSVSVLYAPPTPTVVEIAPASVVQEKLETVADEVVEAAPNTANHNVTALDKETRDELESEVTKIPTLSLGMGNFATVAELYAPALSKKLWNNTSVSELYKAPVTAKSDSSVSVLYAPPVKPSESRAVEEQTVAATVADAAVETHVEGINGAALEVAVTEPDTGAKTTSTTSAPVSNLGTVAELYSATSVKQQRNNSSVAELYKAPVTAQSMSSVSVLYSAPAPAPAPAPVVETSAAEEKEVVTSIEETPFEIQTGMDVDIAPGDETFRAETHADIDGSKFFREETHAERNTDARKTKLSTLVGNIANAVEQYAPAWAKDLWNHSSGSKSENNTTVAQLYQPPEVDDLAYNTSISELYKPPTMDNGKDFQHGVTA